MFPDTPCFAEQWSSCFSKAGVFQVLIRILSFEIKEHLIESSSIGMLNIVDKE